MSTPNVLPLNQSNNNFIIFKASLENLSATIADLIEVGKSIFIISVDQHDMYYWTLETLTVGETITPVGKYYDEEENVPKELSAENSAESLRDYADGIYQSGKFPIAKQVLTFVYHRLSTPKYQILCNLPYKPEA